MSDDLRLPVDFERTHEFRLLVNALKARVPAGKQVTDISIEATAVYIYLRLFVELAFLARTTNRPGYLTRSGLLLLENSLDVFFGSDAGPTDVLTEAMLLEIPQSAAADEGELYCPLFARLNAHFAGNYMTKEQRGNKASLYERQKRIVVQQASQQSGLFPPDSYRKRDGQVMTQTEVARATAIIITIDNSLGLPLRATRQYTEALVADAFETAAKYAREPEVLKEVYIWISNNRANPALPKTTEQILAKFEDVERMAR